MKTTTTAQNSKSKRGRDLGQITKEAYEYQGVWYAVVFNPSGYRICFRETEQNKERLIDMGHAFENGYKTLEISTFRMSLTLAKLTSKSKDDREYAKSRVAEWVEIGRAVLDAGLEAIATAKAEAK